MIKEIEDVIIINSLSEIPTLTERHCFKNNPIGYKFHLNFTVIVNNIQYAVMQFASNKELTKDYRCVIYKQARFVKSINKFKQYTSSIVFTIQDQETINLVLSTFPRYYCVRNEYGLQCIDNINKQYS